MRQLMAVASLGEEVTSNAPANGSGVARKEDTAPYRTNLAKRAWLLQIIVCGDAFTM